MSKLNIGGVVEEVVTSEEFTLEKARKVLKDEVVAIIGYGVQGPRPGPEPARQRHQGHRRAAGVQHDLGKAIEDGWVPGKTLFPLEEAAKRGTIIQYLLSDAGQKSMWPKIKPLPDQGQGPLLLPRVLHRLQGADRRHPACGHRRDPRRPEGVGRDRARPISSTGSGINSSYAVFQDCDGTGPRADPRRRRRHRLRLPLPDDLPAGGLQRPDRRARRADGVPGRRHGGPVQRAAQARPQPERGLQRDRGGADPEPHPAGRRERHGLDVRQLQHHRPARRPGLEGPLPRCRRARSSASSTIA